MSKEKATTKICKHCKTEIPADAKICPQCRKKQGMGCLPKVLIAIVVLGLIGAIFGDGEDSNNANNSANNANVTEQSTQKEKTAKKETTKSTEAPEKTTFGVGETAEHDGLQITLLSATESHGQEYNTPAAGNIFLLLDFEIVNNSKKDFTFSMLDYESYCDDYSVSDSVEAELIDEAEGKNSLGGTVAPGKKLRGVLGYEVPEGYKNFEIKISPDLWSSKDITFALSK